MSNEFLSALKKRRTYYALNKEIPVTFERIQEIVETAVFCTPSAFNSQSARAVVLFGVHHDELWSLAKEIMRKIVPPEAFPKTDEKISSFGAAAGTVLYFEETTIVSDLQKKFPLYKDNFPIWSQQANAMLQSNIWVALEAEGLGASLQHYNPLIDESVKTRWNLPESWSLIAQMSFGGISGAPGEKSSLPVSDRVKVFQ